MTEKTSQPRKRGRPKKSERAHLDTRAELIQSGLAHFTEFGFVASGIDMILKKTGTPKGSFYYYFDSKEAFGKAVIDNYARFFAKRLDGCLLEHSVDPVTRITQFVALSKQGMVKHQFTRGCLVGNLGQEVDLLPETFRALLLAIFTEWQDKLAVCLKEAQRQGLCDKSKDPHALAEFFWVGWEGAVSRAKLAQSTKPLDSYLNHFLMLLK
ncbi:TetR/AcrR family transcriptional regulator [Pseudoalteromonas spongiae]|uniref:acrylate utilization transcriptional regulator AcuR n=1 Tax=Pseudoalteromonas spongiae TaxID=298657 RepID=UPI00026CB79C|nr:TetR/AcrR family transcriptional regulator [Pseudoalteromonas spongiae]ATD01291.1 TetR/AcrR family transcriptional regulator, transcriptional repressor for nem operon [Pseudoalteromonas spongiae UST010723-006]